MSAGTYWVNSRAPLGTAHKHAPATASLAIAGFDVCAPEAATTINIDHAAHEQMRTMNRRPKRSAKMKVMRTPTILREASPGSAVYCDGDEGDLLKMALTVNALVYPACLKNTTISAPSYRPPLTSSVGVEKRKSVGLLTYRR